VHQVTLLQADPVLPAQHTAGGHRHGHDLLPRCVHAFHHAGFALVEHEQRMEVAVASVETFITRIPWR
jgi:hypothetical protein